MRNALRRAIAVLVALAGLGGWGPDALAGDGTGSTTLDNWALLGQVQPGQRIQIKARKRMGKGASGRFVSFDATGIVLETKQGQERVDRQTVRQVSAVPLGKEGYQAAGWVVFGAGVGAGFAIGHASREDSIFGKRWSDKGGLTAVAVLGGCAVSAIVLMARGRPKPVYERADR